MRRIQILSFFIFVAAVASFAVFQLRERAIADHDAPELIMEEERITVPVDAGEDELLAGIRAQDRRDGDVSDTLIIESVSNFIAEGTRQLTFAASDRSGNIVKGHREIVYSDYRAPRFALDAPLRFQVGMVDDILQDVSAQDVLDGDLSGKIKISSSSTFQSNQAGEYRMEFTVANSAGDVSHLPVTVTLYSAEEALRCPELTLTDYLVYTEAGEALAPEDYLQSVILGDTEYVREGDRFRAAAPEDEEDEEEQEAIGLDEISIQDGADYRTPGTYEITYRYTTQDEETGAVRLVVVVTD